jgi:hypothetical protein
MDIEFQGQYDKDTYMKAVSLISQPSRRSTIIRVITFVVFAGLYIGYILPLTDGGSVTTFEMSRLFRHFITFALLGYIIFQPFIVAYTRAKRMWNDLSAKNKVYGALSNQGITIGRAGNLNLPWDRFAKLRRGEDFVVMMTADKNMLILLKGFFENESVWNRAVQLIENKVVEPM